MSSRRTAIALALALLVLTSTRGQSADQVLVAAGSTWRYNDTGANLGTAWRSLGYNDSAWASGLGQLGYGDGDESTLISFGTNPNNRRITYYFRRTFNVANPTAIAALAVRFIRDDGSVIYLNGVEVVRSNMPSGTVSYTTRASAAIGGADESTWLEAPIDPTRLVAGTNLIAVEIHQQSPTSTDVSFDLELRATPTPAQGPTVSLISPVHQSVSNLADVTFTASASAAAGLANATLFLGDPPTTINFSGPTQIDDTQIVGDTPTLAAGSGLSLNVDGQSPHAHALVKVPLLVGSGAGQVPPGAAISNATLSLNCTNAGQAMRIYRLTQSWVEGEATWNERAIGVPWGAVGADGAASNSGVAVTADCTTTGVRQIDITPIVQEWANGTPNHGVVFVESGTDGIDFDSSESASSPVLTVMFKTALQSAQTQSLSGVSSPVSFTATLAIGQAYQWNVRVTDVNGQQAWAPADYAFTVDAASPDEPVAVSPLNGASDVSLSPTLQVSVNNPLGGALNVTAAIRPATAPEFTIIALPDTQHYSESFPAVFTAQTQWIVNNVASRNIVFVTHEGDLVEHNSNATEWQRANTSMSMLDGIVPYGMGPGNHDQPTTLYNQFFPYTRYQGLPWYGGHFENLNDNNYQLFSGGGMDFVIVHLAFCPPAPAVAWADSIFKLYPERVGIMTTHGYLGLGAVRSVHVCGSTQYLWDGLAPGNPNLRFMLSGHVHGEARRTDTLNGRTVFQMLADYQDRASGGEGWLRILRFVPAESKVYVQTYSPWLNQYQTDADSEFTLDFDMGGTFTDVGSTSTQSGSIASIPVSGLDPSTQYEWRATVTNSAGKSRVGPGWRFTTGAGGPINQPPVAGNQVINAIEDVSTGVTLSATDPEAGPLSYTVLSGPAHGTLTGTAPSLIYQPAPDFNGADGITFRASDGQANSNVATITLQVQAQNDPPLAAGDGYSVAGESVLTIAAPGVLGNDSDVDSGTLQAQVAAGPSHGALVLNANGSFVYTPTTGYTGPDSFGYVASDGQSASGVASVALTVTAPVDATPPVRSNAQPTGVLAAGTTQTTISLTTNELATCRYATTTGVAYAAMPTAFSTTGGTGHSTLVTALSSGTSYAYQVRCQDLAGNQNLNDFSIAFSIAVPPDTNAPSVAVTAPSPGAIVSGTVNVIATATDGVGVVGVQFLLDGLALGAEDTAAPFSVSWNSTGSSNGSHQLSARARDAAGNQATAVVVTVTVNNVVVPPGAAGLVAAYSFNEGSGTTLIDRTGSGHAGTVSGATWTGAGKFGGALSFDGVNDWVTIADANDLDFTTGMTLEAWVRPTSVSGWRTVMLKERTGGLAYALYASNDLARVDGYARVSSTDAGLAAPAALAVNQWSHLALTYDNVRMRLYVNGVQVSERTLTGGIATSTGALRLGGNGVWSEFFQGQLDELRVYNRALSAAEVQTDLLAVIQ